MDIKYYGKYNSEGKYSGFYTTDIWDESEIPMSECIELTKEQWVQARKERCVVIDGTHTLVETTQEEVNEAAYSKLRQERDLLLAKCDWTLLPDSPLSETKKTEWATYRQALRDLPASVDINNIVYPTKPN